MVTYVWLCWPCRGVFGALVAGTVAGLWGVTGWIGFTYYLASHAVVSSAFVLFFSCYRADTLLFDTTFGPRPLVRVWGVCWLSTLLY